MPVRLRKGQRTIGCPIAWVFALVRNAVQHARARTIEVELEYGGAMFRLRVRDDGIGVDPDVLERGKRIGHWGMQGMRERAEALGGHLEIWSEEAAGTEVELALPAGIAYA